MYGRFGLLHHLHLTEALAQRRRLAEHVAPEEPEKASSPTGFKASSIIFGLTIMTLATLLTIALVIRLWGTL